MIEKEQKTAVNNIIVETTYQACWTVNTSSFGSTVEAIIDRLKAINMGTHDKLYEEDAYYEAAKGILSIIPYNRYHHTPIIVRDCFNTDNPLQHVLKYAGLNPKSFALMANTVLRTTELWCYDKSRNAPAWTYAFIKLYIEHKKLQEELKR